MKKLSGEQCRAAAILAYWMIATLLFGGVAAPFERIYPFVSVLIATIFIFRVLKAPAGEPSPYRWEGLTGLALALFLLLFILQIVPLPSWPLRHLAPLAHSLTFDTLSKLEIAPRNWGYPVSIDPQATWNLFLQITSAVLLFTAVLEVSAGREARRFLAYGLVIFGAFVSFFGMVHRFSGSKRMYWFLERGATFFGPYINANHAGAFLAVASAVAAGLLFRRTGKTEKMIMASILGLCVLGLLFTGSRGAVLSLLAVAFVLFRSRKTKSGALRTSLKYAIPSTAFLLLLALMWQASFFSRLASTPERFLSGAEYRTRFWAYALALWTDSPWLGVGLGAFAKASPLKVADELFLHPEHAENGPLEILACSGLFGLALLIFLLFLLFLRARDLFTSDSYSHTTRAFFFGVVALLFNTLFTFHLPLPAHQLLWVLLLAGMLSSHSHSLLADSRLKKGIKIALPVALVLCGSMTLRPLKQAPSFLSSASDLPSATEISAGDRPARDVLIAAELEQAISINPLNSHDLYAFATYLIRLGEPQRAREAYLAAAALNPFDLASRAKIALAFSRTDQCAQALEILERLMDGPYLLHSIDKGDLLIEAARCSKQTGQETKSAEDLTRAEELGSTDWRIPLLRMFHSPHPEKKALESWEKCNSQCRDKEKWDWAFIHLMQSPGRKIDPLPVIQAVAKARSDAGLFLERVSELFPEDELPIYVSLDDGKSSPRLKANTPITEGNAMWEKERDPLKIPETFTVRVSEAQPVLDIYFLPVDLLLDPAELSVRMLVSSLRPIEQQLVIDIDGKWVQTPDEPKRLPTGQWELTFKNVATALKLDPETPHRIRGIGFTPLERDGRYSIGPIHLFVDSSR